MLHTLMYVTFAYLALCFACAVVEFILNLTMKEIYREWVKPLSRDKLLKSLCFLTLLAFASAAPGKTIPKPPPKAPPACVNDQPRDAKGVCGAMPLCPNRCVSGAPKSAPASCWNHPDYAKQVVKGKRCAYTYPPVNTH